MCVIKNTSTLHYIFIPIRLGYTNTIIQNIFVVAQRLGNTE